MDNYVVNLDFLDPDSRDAAFQLFKRLGWLSSPYKGNLLLTVPWEDDSLLGFLEDSNIMEILS